MATTHRPRVLVVTPWFPTNIKPGAGIFVLRDVLMLTEFAEVTVVHVGAPQFFEADHDREPTWPEFTTIRSPFAFSNYRSILQAAQVIRKQLRHADALHTMAFEGLTPLNLLRVGVPWLHTEHWTGMLSEPQGASVRARRVQHFLRRALRRIDAPIAVSQMLAQAMQPWVRKPVSVIANEVPLPAELPEPGAWDHAELRMVSVGSLESRKGVVEALEALIALRERGHEATLTLIGEGSLREPLLEQAAAAGVAAHVSLPGQLPPDAVHEALREANLALMPTRLETFGVALAEAMGEGLPLVTGNHGGFMDFLDPSSSVAVDVAEIGGRQLADAVLELVGREGLPSRHEIASRAAIAFDSGARAKQYVEAYAGVGVHLQRVAR